MSVLAPARGANTFVNTGALVTARTAHTATLLPNGKVLVAGGQNAATLSRQRGDSTIRPPAPGRATGTLATARYYHTATLLPNGKVLVAGGSTAAASSPARSSTIRPPAPGAPPARSPPRATWHTATLLPNGKVLVAGGLGSGGSLASAELYDPATGTWSATGALATARAITPPRCCPTARCSSRGAWQRGAISPARSFTIRPPALGAPPPPSPPRAIYHTATLLPNGKVLVAGG